MMGRLINGVLGPIDTAELGPTLIHEHVVTCCDWSMRMALGSLYYDEEEGLRVAVEQLKRAKAHGIRSMVDGTPINLGRDVRSIIRAARESGINVIASSGFYHQEEAIAGVKSEDELAELLYKDCTLGMQDTEALPGILKCAADWKGFTPYIVKLLNATARVSVRTKLPIFAHSIPELHQGGALMDLFESYGVPANAVVIGHHGDTEEIDYLESVLQRGCYLGLDRFGVVTANPSTRAENRADTLAALVRRGYADRLLISHDYAPYNGFWPSWEEFCQPGYSYGLDFCYFSEVIVPLLLERGLQQEEIDLMLRDNPKRFFEEAYS